MLNPATNPATAKKEDKPKAYLNPMVMVDKNSLHPTYISQLK